MKVVPTNKLLFWFGMIYLPLSILMALVPGSTAAGIVLAIGLLILVVVDVVISRGCLTGIHVALPEVVRLSAGREGRLTLSIENDDIKIRRLRLGLAFPGQIYSSHQDRIANLPDNTPNSFIDWPFRALKQGSYRLQNCYLETPSRFGFQRSGGAFRHRRAFDSVGDPAIGAALHARL